MVTNMQYRLNVKTVRGIFVYFGFICFCAVLAGCDMELPEKDDGFSFDKVVNWTGGNPEYPVGPFVAGYKETNRLKVSGCGRYEFERPLTWEPPKAASGNPINCSVVACWGQGRYTCMAWDWCGTKGTSAFSKNESCAQGPEYYVFVISVPGGERTNVVRIK